MWPWTGKLISESLSFCLCKVWVMMLICSSCLEDDEWHLHSPQCPTPSRCSINVSYKGHPPRWGIPLYSAGRHWPHHYKPAPALWAPSHHTWENRLFSNTPPSAFFLLPSRWAGQLRKCSVPPKTCAQKRLTHTIVPESSSKACTRNFCLSADNSSISRNNEKCWILGVKY